MIIDVLSDGICINGDSTSQEVFNSVLDITGDVPLIASDPPYGNIVDESWDKTKMSDIQFAEWMIKWTKIWKEALIPGGAFFMFGVALEFQDFVHL